MIERDNGALLSGRAVFLVDASGTIEFANPKYGFKPGGPDNLALMKAVRGGK